MSPRAARLVAAVVVLTNLILVALAFVLGAANGDDLVTLGSSLLVISSFTLTGALVLSRRSANPIGWLFCAVGFLWASGIFAEGYAVFAYVTEPGSLFLPIVTMWYLEWNWILFIYLGLVFTFLLFPTGRPLSRRWSIAGWVIVASMASFTILAMFESRLSLREQFTIVNPLGISSLHDVEDGLVGGLLFLFLFSSIGVAAVSLVVRFVRSRGEERQQLKWFTYAGGLLFVVFLSQVVLDGLFGVRSNVLDRLFLLSLSLVPVSAGIAILRYRLYDIDRIINRTIVYGALSAVLATGYFGAVVLLQGVLPVSNDSPMTVAASTLGMIALFRPVRNRIQDLVDRRFNRRRFDAIRTIDDFSARLRAETNLDSLSSDLVGIVRHTMQPAHVSLWLHPSATAPRKASTAK